MKTTYKKPITEITILHLQGSVLDDMTMAVGNNSRFTTYGDANTGEFDAEDDVLLPKQGSLWDE